MGTKYDNHYRFNSQRIWKGGGADMTIYRVQESSL